MSRTPLETKIGQAAVTLICNSPFFATLLLSLDRIEGHVENNVAIPGPCTCAPGVMWPKCTHSMATDGKRLIVNPRFVEYLSVEQLVGVLAHEVMHVAGLHPWRRGARNPEAWNYACDQAVNAILEESHITLPPGCVPGVKDLSAEELYQKLPDKAKSVGSVSVMFGGDGKGKNGLPGLDIGKIIEPRNPDGSPLSDQERSHQEGEAKIRITQAATAAKRAGKLPAGLQRLVDETIEPKVPWKEILARFIDGNHRNDYSWTRLNRRYLSQELLLPSLWSPGYGEVVMGCDTSGSVDQAQLREICSELLGCLDTYQERGQPIELKVAWFDHKVYPQVIQEPEELNPQGGGGTAFSVVFDWVREEGLTPKAVIMITDGYSSDFGTAPDCPVLWILTQANKSFEPPFGEVACTLNN